MKTKKIIYWISTGLLSAMMLFSASMYLTKTDEVREAFTNLGFPLHLIYPLAFAKILGVVAILGNFNKELKDWAYKGFFYNFLLAVFAHLYINDGKFAGALVAMILLLTSYAYNKQLLKAKT